MRERRWPWLLAAALMLAAAAAIAWATYLHWLPCRGTLLSGSLLRSYRYGPGFSRACYRRMDTGLPFPYPPERAEQTAWASELGVVAMVFVSAAWVGVVLAQRWPLRTTTVALLPSVATLAAAVDAAEAIGTAIRSPGDFASLWLLLGADAAAVAALVAVRVWQPEVPGRLFRRLVVLIWGTTAFSFVHLSADYAFMIIFSDANWDTPPLSGYLTAAAIAVSAVLTAGLTLRRPQSQANAGPAVDLSTALPRG